MGEEKKPQEKKSLKDRMEPFRNAATFVNMPITLLSCTLVGAGIGYLIERKWPANGIVLAVFCMLGVAAGFREILITLKNEEKKRKKDE